MKPPRVIATLCHACRGSGVILHLVASANGGTREAVRKCESCNGSGRLKGFVPPA